MSCCCVNMGTVDLSKYRKKDVSTIDPNVEWFVKQVAYVMEQLETKDINQAAWIVKESR